MNIIDLHCDLLEKVSRNPNLNVRNADYLQSNIERLKKGNVKIQVFALFISPKIPQEEKFNELVRQLNVFHSIVLKQKEMVHIVDWKQINELQEGQIGAVLSLEGCDAIGEDLGKLQYAIDRGVKLVGLTWNYENALAFGTSENPMQGLKPFGKKVVEFLNKQNIILDVAHLNKQGFYDVLPQANSILASHCNANALCQHPRNLDDRQVEALVAHGGRIHVVFYPPFINANKKTAKIQDLIKHIDHLYSLVGMEYIGLGSDFDGIDDLYVENLDNASKFPNLINELLKKYREDEVKLLASKGFENFIQNK